MIDDQHSVEEIKQQNMVDYIMYAVVGSAEKYLCYGDISQNFTHDFKLGVGDEYL